MRARLLHAVRDPRGDGGRLRRVPRAGILLSAKPRRAGEWWESYFDAQYLLEYQPIFRLERDREEVARLIEILALPVGARVLDVPCGQGRHAHLLAEAGYDVRGLDYSPDLIRLAKRRGEGRTLRYTRGDMRRMPAAWTGRFDAVVNLFTSFGFFLDPADDRRVIEEFARVLAPGGVLVWHGGSRDGVMAHFLARDWWKADDGTLIAHERSFDPLGGILHIRSSWSGLSGEGEREHRIRLYTATRLAELCAGAGLIVEQAFDGWKDRPLRRASSEMLLVARKVDSPPAARRTLPSRRPGR
ncbi:MAG TPA: methyltransferase domain-containing protein [Gemmatimonadaceae bacterium]|nr:methyltransferase domain-containing protein [Gemmatimonadaceae bacterium]